MCLQALSFCVGFFAFLPSTASTTKWLIFAIASGVVRERVRERVCELAVMCDLFVCKQAKQDDELVVFVVVVVVYGMLRCSRAKCLGCAEQASKPHRSGFLCVSAKPNGRAYVLADGRYQNIRCEIPRDLP